MHLFLVYTQVQVNSCLVIFDPRAGKLNYVRGEIDRKKGSGFRLETEQGGPNGAQGNRVPRLTLNSHHSVDRRPAGRGENLLLVLFGSRRERERERKVENAVGRLMASPEKGTHKAVKNLISEREPRTNPFFLT